MKTHAFPLQLAKEAILLDRYSDAVSLLKPLSAVGDFDAQFLHAYLHFWDDDLSRNEAVELMSVAADADHAEATYILAVCPDLLPGYDFKLPQEQLSLNRLRHAANLGSDAALTDLAQCYLEGVVVNPDSGKARQLLLEVYENGEHYNYYPKNCFLLGRLQVHGLGDDQDIDNGLRVLKRCNLGDSFALEALRFGIKTIEDEQERLNIDLSWLVSEFENQMDKLSDKPIALWQSFIHYYCANTLKYDLSGVSLEALMDFVFDHFPGVSRDYDRFRLDQLADVIFDPPELLRIYTQLFQNSAQLPERYSIAQIEQGFGMYGIRGWANWTIGCVMSSAANSIDDIEACIRAMYDLFVYLFSKPDFADIGYMWWDIGYGACSRGWHEERTLKEQELTDQERQRLAQAEFDTLVRVLHMNNKYCQEAAIHGLGHSIHPDKGKVLRQYLADNPELSMYMHEYVIRAIDGQIM